MDLAIGWIALPRGLQDKEALAEVQTESASRDELWKMASVSMDGQPDFDGFFTDRMIAQPLSEADLPEYRRLLQDRRVMATLSADGQPFRG